MYYTSIIIVGKFRLELNIFTVRIDNVYNVRSLVRPINFKKIYTHRLSYPIYTSARNAIKEAIIKFYYCYL